MSDWFDSSFGFDVKSVLESEKPKPKKASKKSKSKKTAAQNDLELGIQGFQNTINGINFVAKNFKSSISGPTEHQKNLALSKKAKQYEDEEKAYLAAQKAQGKIDEIKRKRAYRKLWIDAHEKSENRYWDMIRNQKNLFLHTISKNSKDS